MHSWSRGKRGVLGLGEHCKLSQRGLGQKMVLYNLISAGHFCLQQVTANSSPLSPEKWGTLPLRPKKWGYQYPSYPVNYAYRMLLLLLLQLLLLTFCVCCGRNGDKSLSITHRFVAQHRSVYCCLLNISVK